MNQKIQKLIEYLAKLPGIGQRQATRLALALINWDKSELEELGSAISQIKNGSLFCSRCFNFAENELCRICSDTKRNKNKIAVVEKVLDLDAIEKAGIYDGTYHILGGSLEPSVGPDKIRIRELFDRIREERNGGELEIIIATNPTTYGETTALYLAQKLKPLGVSVTRLAQGLSAGLAIEYSDEITLANAVKHG